MRYLCLLFMFLTGCGSPELNITQSDHFDGELFHNLNEPRLKKSILDFIRWRFFSKRDKWPEYLNIVQQKVPQNRVKNGQVSVTFINHATSLIQIDGVNILTDPIYSERASTLSFFGPKRVKLPGVRFDDLPKIDLILISHNHYDSFDTKTIKDLINRDNPKILFGIGNSYYLGDSLLSNVKEMDWNDSYKFQNLKIVFLPAKHWSKRMLNDTNKSLWGSFAILGSKQIYFAGDTGYADHFKDIQQKFGGFDLSLIPIGAYKPRWFMKAHHLNPDEAVKVHSEIRSRKSIGIHFGTFQLTNEGIEKPVVDLEKARKKYNISNKDFFVLKEGETYMLKK